MATAAQIQDLRQYVNEDSPESSYTDDYLGDKVDEAGSVSEAAAIIWRLKAADAADLVTTSEAGSTHSFSDLHKHALAMEQSFRRNPLDTNTGRRTRVSKIERD